MCASVSSAAAGQCVKTTFFEEEGLMNVEREVAQSQGTRRAVVATPYVPYHGVSSAPQLYAEAIYNIFLPLTGRGAHYEGATSWAHVKVGDDPDGAFYFLQLLLLMADTPSIGSRRPLLDAGPDDARYAALARLAARERLHDTLSAGEAAHLHRSLRADHYVDRLWERRVREAEVRVQVEQSLGADRRRKKRRTRAKTFDWTTYSTFLLTRGPRGAIKKKVPKAELLRAPAEDEEEPGPDVEAAVREALAALPPYDEEAPAVLAKVQLTVTPVPAAGALGPGPFARHQDVCGLLCRFIVRDPSLNPGAFFDVVYENAVKRAQQGPRGSFGQRWRDLFENYGEFFWSHHPAGRGVCTAQLATAVRNFAPDAVAGIAPDSVNLALATDFRRFGAPLHLRSLCSIARACAHMQAAGAAEYAAFAWEAPGMATYPAAGPTYVYPPEMLFWIHPTYLGISEQRFPWFDTSQDFLSAVLARLPLDVYLQGGPRPERPLTDRDIYLRDNWLVTRERAQRLTDVKYPCYNEFIHLAYEAKRVHKRLACERPSHHIETVRQVQALQRTHGAAWRAHLGDPAPVHPSWHIETQRTRRRGTEPLAARVAACERFNKLLALAVSAFQVSFVSLWRTEGDIDSLPIPPTIKTMLHWFRSCAFPNVTREFEVFDASLGLLGNSMLRTLHVFTDLRKAVQPYVCLLLEPLFSAYRWAPRDLAFNMMLHGRYEGGKTFLAVSTPADYMCIPGTVNTGNFKTPAADTTARHVYDEIFAADEVAAWKTNEEEAKLKPDLVNKEKQKMTGRQLTMDYFAPVKLANGSDVRWSKTQTTDHHYAEVAATNSVVASKGALTSRSFCVIVPHPKIPPSLFNGAVGETLDDDGKIFLQLNQYLSACCYKAIATGPLREPDMELWKDVSTRVIKNLAVNNLIDASEGTRNLDMMKAFAIQIVVHQALRCVFDMPNSPHWKQPFRPEHMTSMAPYLYCTTDVVVWVWSATASAWIDEKHGQVLAAAAVKAGVPRQYANACPYALFERDADDTIKWRLRENRNHVGDKRGGDDKLIDIQYVTLEGTFESICRDIAAYAAPLDWTDVSGVLTLLKDKRVKVTGGAFQPAPRGTFKYWHRYAGNAKPTPNTDGLAFPSELLVDEHDTGDAPRTVDKVLRLPLDTLLPIVEVEKDRIHVLLGIAGLFSYEQIEVALADAITCRTTRPGKYLLCAPFADNSLLMRTLTLDDQRISEAVAAYDQAAGYGLCSVGLPGGTVPRYVGLHFERKSSLIEPAKRVLTGKGLAPTAAGSERERLARYSHDAEAMSEENEVVEDLDYESALRQHCASGQPVDAPVRSPAWIAEHLLPPSQAMRYPDEWMAHLQRRDTKTRALSDTFRDAGVARKIFARAPADAPAPDIRLGRAARSRGAGL
jgi:hypothetical protein